MQTENLQELIKEDADQVIFSNVEDKPLTWEDSEKDHIISIPSDIDSSNSNSDHEQDSSLIPFPAEAEMIPEESQTEEELIAYTKLLHTRLAMSTVQSYWLIGKSILAFYKGEYGTGELQRISDATGIGRDTLTKACKFARQFTEEQVKNILKGKFILSWFEVCQNLTVAPQNLIAAYQASSSSIEFHNAIMKLKNPNEKRGKKNDLSEATGNRQGAIAENPQNTKVTQVSQEQSDAAIIFQAGESSDTAQFKKEKDNGPRELESLKIENQNLKVEIAKRDEKIRELRHVLEEASKDIDSRDETISFLKDKLRRVSDMLAEGFEYMSILDVIAEEE
jgi:hypothetical protein